MRRIWLVLALFLAVSVVSTPTAEARGGHNRGHHFGPGFALGFGAGIPLGPSFYYGPYRYYAPPPWRTCYLVTTPGYWAQVPIYDAYGRVYQPQWVPERYHETCYPY